MKNANIKKFTRLLALLSKMAQGSINLAVEAKEMGFTMRTLERDMRELENAGFPLTMLSPGVYAMVEGFTLHRMPLSARDEALLMLMGQVAAVLGPSWQESYQRLLQHAARPQGKDIYFVKMPRMYQQTDRNVLEQIEQAILQRKYINVFYQTPRRRVYCNHIRPLKIALFEGFWYLVALNDVNTYMKFSLGKILKVIPRKETFAPVEINDKLQKSPNIWFDMRGRIKIKCRIAAAVAHYFREVEFFPKQKIESTCPNGDLLLSCYTANYMQVIPQIKRWLPYIRVVYPKKLDRQIRQELAAYLAAE